jgi:hypothetical protein
MSHISFSLHIAVNGMMSVDVVSSKHSGVSKFRTYWFPTAASVDRLRRAYAIYRKRFYVAKGWSVGRMQSYRTAVLLGRVEFQPRLPCSLDSLSTKVPA